MRELRTQLRVVDALIIRETRASFGTSQIGYLWAVVTPCFSVAILSFIFMAIDRQAPFGTSLPVFFATGILIIELFNKLSTTLMSAFQANKALFAYPVIKEIDTLYARSILIALTYFLIMTIIFGTLYLLGLGLVPMSIDQVLLAFALTVWIGTGLGIVNAAIVSIWGSWSSVEKVLTKPLMFISGVFYVPSRLPSAASDLLSWNPIIHVVEIMREGFYGNYNSQLADPIYPALVGLILIFGGLCIEVLTRKRRAGL